MKNLSVLALLLPLFGQTTLERPRMGHYVDRQGNLRPLYGVAGAVLPGPAIQSCVLSAANLDGWFLWKTDEGLYAQEDDAEPRFWPGPPGPARFLFTPEGPAVWFESDESALRWEPIWNDFVSVSWLRSSDFPEGDQTGGWNVTRTAEAVRLVRGADTLTIPEPAEDGPKLYQVNGQEEAPVSNPVVFPQTAVGDNVILRFRVRNPAPEALNIYRLTASIGAFRITDGFTTPRLIPAGKFEDFWVRFAPQAAGESSAVVTINTSTFQFVGNAPAWPALESFDSDRWTIISSGQAFNLGSTERRSLLVRKLRLTNRNPVPITVARPVVKESAFSVSSSWPEPASLSPGESAEFELRFQAESAGTFAATLEVGAQRFPLRAEALEHPLPRPALSFSSSISSGRQERIVVKLQQAARSAGTGLLKLEFAPEGGLPDDPSILFPVNGTRTALFQVKEGSDQGDFGGQDGIVIQTGTTAGTLVLTTILGNFVETTRIPLERRNVVVASAHGLKAELGLEVRLTAFDNTHSASELAFTFYLRNGQVVSPGRMNVDISKAIHGFFSDNPRSGGIFALRANFPVSGSTAELERVEVEIANPAGTTKLDPIKF